MGTALEFVFYLTINGVLILFVSISKSPVINSPVWLVTEMMPDYK